MKALSLEAEARIKSRRPIIAGAARFAFGPGETYCYWSGLGKITHDGNEFIGLGDAALIAPIASAVGGGADGLTISLSGLDPDVAVLIENETYAQKPVTIWRWVFDADGKDLLDAMVFMRGRVDFITQSEQVGGKASLEVVVEGPRRDMNRSGGRVNSNSDQRVLGGSGDASHKHITYTGRKTMYWGQKPSTLGASNPALSAARLLLGVRGGFLNF